MYWFVSRYIYIIKNVICPHFSVFRTGKFRRIQIFIAKNCRVWPLFQGEFNAFRRLLRSPAERKVYLMLILIKVMSHQITEKIIIVGRWWILQEHWSHKLIISLHGDISRGHIRSLSRLRVSVYRILHLKNQRVTLMDLLQKHLPSPLFPLCLKAEFGYVIFGSRTICRFKP